MLSFCFLWDYVMNLAYRLKVTQYIVSFEGMVDVTSIAPGTYI